LSLFGDYIRERLGKEIVETDDGFATYYFPEPGCCYIEDIYVRPEARRTGAGSRLADQVTEIALSKGSDRLIGSVDPKAFGSTDSMKALLAYGFELHGTDGKLIYLKKEIGG
jgi:GNAT superfamily N-acetyltransferase